MMRPHSPPRATWRRANSAIRSAAARASTPSTWSIDPALHGGLRQAEAVRGGGDERVADPARGVVDQNGHRSQLGLRSIEAGPGTLDASDRSASTAAARPPPARMDSATLSARAMRVAR